MNETGADMTSEQHTQLLMLFSQQDILNQIIIDYNKKMKETQEQFKEPILESVIGILKSVVNTVNTRQSAIDIQIKQIQNDIRARLN